MSGSSAWGFPWLGHPRAWDATWTRVDWGYRGRLPERKSRPGNASLSQSPAPLCLLAAPSAEICAGAGLEAYTKVMTASETRAHAWDALIQGAFNGHKRAQVARRSRFRWQSRKQQTSPKPGFRKAAGQGLEP